MTDPTPRAGTEATFADLEALPEGTRAELIHGVIHVSPRPDLPHVLAASTLGMILGNTFQRGIGGPGGGWILQEPELRLGRHSLAPDIAGWRKERLGLPSRTAFADIAPDWICEILSPDKKGRKKDLQDKPPIYHQHRVQFLWLLDPVERRFDVFRAEPSTWGLVGIFTDDALVKAPPFEALEIDLLELWGEQREPGTSVEE